MAVEVRRLTGSEIAAAVRSIAELRIEVFAAFPYLYDGDPEYEARYLREYVSAPDAVLIAAFDGTRMVGAATAAPMAHQKPAFRKPFEVLGLDTDRLFYFGESVLQPHYRGRGIGHAFFDLRENHALQWGATATCFAAVIRGDDHPARPEGHLPLDGFWIGRGYAIVPGLQTALSWKEHGEPEESEKLMQYWLRQW